MNKFKSIAIQISPISFIDEGVDSVHYNLWQRVGENVPRIGTVSWRGLKTGRSTSHNLNGWQDPGMREPVYMKRRRLFQPLPGIVRPHGHQGFLRQRRGDGGIRRTDGGCSLRHGTRHVRNT